MERQEKTKNVGGSETDEVKKTFFQKVKLFFCFCTEKKSKDNSRLKKFRYAVKKSNNKTRNSILSNDADECFNLNDEPQKSFLGKLKSIFSSIMGKKRKNKHCLKKSRTADERHNLTDEPQKTFPEKVKSFFCPCKEKKAEVQNPAKSPRTFIKQKWKLVVFFFVIYIIIAGGVISVPFIVNHIKVISKNETKKERFKK